MKSYYLRGFKKRYSINEDGIITKHYKYNNQKKRFYKDTICAKNFVTKAAKSPAVSLCVDGKMKSFYVNTLMMEYFSIIPPDNNHRYTINYLDGNPKNNSVKNLGWEMLTTKNYEFKPKAFSENGIVKSKICGVCGENRDILEFSFSCVPDSTRKKYTYRNECEPCRSESQHEKIMNNTTAYQKKQEAQKRWRSTTDGKAYYKQYMKIHGKKKVVELHDCYVNWQAVKNGFPRDSITPEMTDIFRLTMRIKRHIKTNN